MASDWREVCGREYDDRPEWGKGDYYDLVRERNHLARFAEKLATEARVPQAYYEAQREAWLARLWEESADG